jgi:hypothetical protein
MMQLAGRMSILARATRLRSPPLSTLIDLCWSSLLKEEGAEGGPRIDLGARFNHLVDLFEDRLGRIQLLRLLLGEVVDHGVDPGLAFALLEGLGPGEDAREGRFPAPFTPTTAMRSPKVSSKSKSRKRT